MLADYKKPKSRIQVVSITRKLDESFDLVFTFQSVVEQEFECFVAVSECYEKGIPEGATLKLQWWKCPATKLEQTFIVTPNIDSHTFNIPSVNIKAYNFFRLYVIINTVETLVVDGIAYD